jgi:hypothetical protein
MARGWKTYDGPMPTPTVDELEAALSALIDELMRYRRHAARSGRQGPIEVLTRTPQF